MQPRVDAGPTVYNFCTGVGKGFDDAVQHRGEFELALRCAWRCESRAALWELR
jgi:hypothetical protein